MYIYIYTYIYICLGMAKNSPCLDVVTRRNGGVCSSAQSGPGPPMGGLGLPKWVLGWTHGLRASAKALGAGTLLFGGLAVKISVVFLG